MSLNVCGLNEDMKVSSVWNYIQQFKHQVDILALQEHKLRVENAKALRWRIRT
jgi:exonuclease III